MRQIILSAILLACLLAVSCGKNTPDVAPAPQAEPKRETTVTTAADADTKTISSESIPAAPVSKLELYAGLEIPDPPPPPKFTRLPKDKAVWGVANKTLLEVVEILGYPSVKKPRLQVYYPEGWLYEWETVVVETKKDGNVIEYPRLGVFFETRNSSVSAVYLNEYLTGELK